MTESTERVGAHVLHPDFNLANAHRLIAALRGAAHVNIACVTPLEIDGSHVTKEDVLDRSVDIEGSDPERIPVAFNHGSWSMHLRDRIDPRYSCGTAACIAGFAHLLLQADKGRTLSVRDMSRLSASADKKTTVVRSLAEFLGTSIAAAERISEMPDMLSGSSVKPRHAVAMLEYFIETGNVEWDHAIGKVEDGDINVTEEERKMMHEDIIKVVAAIRARTPETHAGECND